MKMRTDNKISLKQFNTFTVDPFKLQSEILIIFILWVKAIGMQIHFTHHYVVIIYNIFYLSWTLNKGTYKTP